MKFLLAYALLASACAGPGQNALANTPTAQTKRTPGEAPAASSSDDEREHMIKANDDMTDAQSAHREATNGSSEKVTAPAPAPTTAPTAKPKTQPASPDKAPK
jgi:hypothetical protein